MLTLYLAPYLEEQAKIRLRELGYIISKIRIIEYIIDRDIIIFEYPDEPDSREGGRTMWKVDLIGRQVCHKDHSVGSFWTEWEDCLNDHVKS